jgi:putative spermidine/putrescine transport system ATP-binding protein
MSSSAYLTIKDLTLAYGDSVAVAGLNFEVGNGEFVSLLGPSGCGKTTTMRAIAGLLEPSAGQIFLGGQDITKVPPNKRDIGLVFQSYALFPHLSVFDNVAFGLKLKGVRGDELTRLVDEALASVGLSGYAKRLPKELSGGQQQRVALARSIVVRTRAKRLRSRTVSSS